MLKNKHKQQAVVIVLARGCVQFCMVVQSPCIFNTDELVTTYCTYSYFLRWPSQLRRNILVYVRHSPVRREAGCLLPTQTVTAKHPYSGFITTQRDPSDLYTWNNVDYQDLLRRPVETFPERFPKPGIHHCTNNSWVSKSEIPGCGCLQVRSRVISTPQRHFNRRSEGIQID